MTASSVRRAGASARRILRFGIVGAINTGVDLAIFAALFYALRWDPLLSNVASYSAGVACSFLLNNGWTFGDVAQKHGMAQRILRFAAVNLISLAAASAVLASLMALGLDGMVAKCLSIVVTFLVNYTLSKQLVFAARKDAGSVLPDADSQAR